MDKEQISHIQLGVLFFVFMTGSSIINVPGPLIGKAGNGAWISLILSGAAGFAVLAMLLYLAKRFPDLTYADYSRKLIGSVPATVLGLLSLTFMLQMLSAMVMDVALFMVSSMLRETPLYIFTSLTLLIAALTARAGIEVMARMFMFIVIITALFLLSTLLLSIPEYMPQHLLPILPKGFKPVLHGAYFSFGFPFAEVFVFGMLIPFVAPKNRGRIPATLSIALIFNLFTLSTATIGGIMAFGPYAGEIPYVLYSMARLVEFQEIIQRIESIIGMSLILGSYMKTSITLYAISLFVGRLFRLRDSSVIVMPLALLGFITGMVTYDGPSGWGASVTSVHPIWAAAVFIIPLMLLTIMAVVRKKAG